MTMAGAKPINWIAVTAEWAPDYVTKERAVVAQVWSEHGGAPAMLTDFNMAQIKAGLVKVPDSLRQFPAESGGA